MRTERSRTERVLTVVAGVATMAVGVVGCSSGGGSPAAASVTEASGTTVSTPATTGGGKPTASAAVTAAPATTPPVTPAPNTVPSPTAAPATTPGSAPGAGDLCSMFDLAAATALAKTTPVQSKGTVQTDSPATTKLDDCGYTWDGGGVSYMVVAYHGVPAAMAVAGAKAAGNTPGLTEFPVDLGDASYGYTSSFSGKTGAVIVVVKGETSVSVSDNAPDAATAQAMALDVVKVLIAKVR